MSRGAVNVGFGISSSSKSTLIPTPICSQNHPVIPLDGAPILSGSYEEVPSSCTKVPSVATWSLPASATGPSFMVI